MQIVASAEYAYHVASHPYQDHSKSIRREPINWYENHLVRPAFFTNWFAYRLTPSCVVTQKNFCDAAASRVGIAAQRRARERSQFSNLT